MPRVQRHELDDAWCLAGFSRHGKFQAGSSLLQTSHVFEIFWAFWSEPRWSAACGPCLTLCYFSALTRVGRAGPSFLRSGIRFRTRQDTSLHHIIPTCARERCMWATCVCAHGTSSNMQAARRVVLLRRCRGKQRWVRFVPHAFPILWCQHPVLSRERPPYNFRTLPVGPPSSCQSREMLSNDEWVGDPFALEKARGWCWQRSLILSASHIVHLVCATVALLFCESVAGPTDQHVKPTAPEACAFAPAPARPKSPMRGALGMQMHATYLCQVLFTGLTQPWIFNYIALFSSNSILCLDFRSFWCSCQLDKNAYCTTARQIFHPLFPGGIFPQNFDFAALKLEKGQNRQRPK